ncbi:DegT/DnrJ/EryC1/StrS family aminotransferase [Candidatus Pelagibacter sp.]|uniref:DegT/DnrJ/EryC1/StrS family aminotransferase n=1 Tax=Candidatus Pelagibacter sp. TaxID=2024849 RepID=UPI003D0E5FC8
MKINFVDLKYRYKTEKNDLNRIYNRVLKSGNLILSNDVLNLENQIAKKLNVKYCVSLNSGTDALMMALWALGIKKRDEVITSTISFIATAGSIAHVGAKPVFVDCDKYLNIDVNKIEKAITKKTKAIMPVHWTGRMANILAIKRIAKKFNLKIIEDGAQSIGSVYKGYKPGQLSDVATFSAHPLKPLNALGDGGYLVTNSKKIYQSIKLYRNHGLKNRDNAEIFGVNSRLDALHAGVISFRLTKLKNVIKLRERNIKRYKSKIKTKFFRIIDDEKNTQSTHAMFVCLAESRDKLNNFLRKKGIESLIYYGNPLHLHNASKNVYKYKKGDYPVAEDICDKVISLPFHQGISLKKIDFICKTINNFYEK